MQFSIAALLSVLAVASALPAELQQRDATTCGNTYYSASAVDAASQAACNYVQNGETAGSSTYPHQYKDYEGFSFGGVQGPYYEFPILSSGRIYSGGTFPTTPSKA